MNPESTEVLDDGQNSEQTPSVDHVPDLQQALPGMPEPPPETAKLPFEDEEEEERYDQLKAIIEALVYITEEPLQPDQLAEVLEVPKKLVVKLLHQLAGECDRPDRGLWIREVAGGFVMGTKPEHHEVIRHFVRKLVRPLKLSAAALETLAVIAYKQPVTAPEVTAIRGVQGASAIKTLIDHKLVATAGRKNVIGKPILYKTTKEFLIQFGLKSLDELPTLKEFEELSRLAFQEDEEAAETDTPEYGPEADKETAPEDGSDSSAEPAAGESSDAPPAATDGTAEQSDDPAREADAIPEAAYSEQTHSVEGDSSTEAAVAPESDPLQEAAPETGADSGAEVPEETSGETPAPAGESDLQHKDVSNG